MRTLVTGADGFIGGHLVRSLAHAGQAPAGVVYGREAGPGEVRVDLTKPAELAGLPDDIEAVVHAAGTVDSQASRAHMLAVNVHATENLLAWALRRGVRHFVHVSSVAVYGPLTLGEGRSERTPRLGLRLGLPYMRTKALAELAVERSGVPYTLLRPPVVLGAGDTVLSRGFRAALTSGGLPLVPGARADRRVSLALGEGLGAIVSRLLDHRPLYGPLHAVDVELSLAELAGLYARALGSSHGVALARIGWLDAFRARDEVGLAWLVASARFGQHYRRERLVRELGYRSSASLESAIQSGLSSLQGGSERLF